jgi:hypothetical protein
MVTTRSGKKTVPLQKKKFSGGSGSNQRLKEWYYLPKEQKNMFHGNRISEGRIKELNKEYFQLCNSTQSEISFEEWSEEHPVVFELNYGSGNSQVKFCFSKADLPSFRDPRPLNPFNMVPLTREEMNELRRVRAEIQNTQRPAERPGSGMTQEERMRAMAAHGQQLAAEARFQREQEEWLRREQQQNPRGRARSRSRTQDRSPTELGLTQEEYDAAYAADVAHQNGELGFQERPRRATPSIQPTPNRTQSRGIIDPIIPGRRDLLQREADRGEIARRPPMNDFRITRNNQPFTPMRREFYSINFADMARETETLRIVFLFGPRTTELNESQNEFLRNLFSSQIDRTDTLDSWKSFTMNFTLDEYQRDFRHAMNEMNHYIIENHRTDYYRDFAKLSETFELFLRQMRWREGLKLQVLNFLQNVKPILRERNPDANFVSLNLNRFLIEYLVKIFTRENIRQGKIQKFS